MDTEGCMGSGISQAQGMKRAGVKNKVVAIIGDSTFMHAGIPGLINAVYNESPVTIIILDNGTTAMTGGQEHPGTGISLRGMQTQQVAMENVARGIGVKHIQVIDAFDLKTLQAGLQDSLDRTAGFFILLTRTCAVRVRRRANPRAVNAEKCNQCGLCLRLGCPAIQSIDGHLSIDKVLCIGDACALCEHLCPRKAIAP